jgi:hypothetical protein
MFVVFDIDWACRSSVSQGATYMTYVPRNTFLSQLKLPAGTPISLDPRQFSGSVPNFITGTCPKLYSDETGLEFCPALCVNSCPELNPVLKKAQAEQLSQAQNQLSAADTALNVTADAVEALNEHVEVTGLFTFSIPDSATLADIEEVRSRISTELPDSLELNFTITVRACFDDVLPDVCLVWHHACM